MPAKSHKILSSTVEGTVGHDQTVHWRPVDASDNIIDVDETIKKLPPGTRLKISEVHTLHIFDNVVDGTPAS